jgi:hypothetical protein
VADFWQITLEPEDEISNTRQQQYVLEVTILVAFSWEALLKDFYMDSGFNHRLELFHGSFLKHVELYGIIPSPTPELSQVTHQANVCCCRVRNRSIMPGGGVSYGLPCYAMLAGC